MRRKRVEIVRAFIKTGVYWNNLIFSDEKLFTLHGTDSFYCWMQKNQSPSRVKKISRSPSLMVWAMIMSNGLLSYEIMTGKQKLTNCINIIKTKPLPIIKVNIKDNFMFQQDNCPIHKSKETLEFFRQSGVALLDWSLYIPDLNIIKIH